MDHIILPSAKNFSKAFKNETQISKLQGKNACKIIYDISAYYFKKMKSVNGPNVAERFLKMRELAGLEMEPLALKYMRMDLGRICCVTNSQSNDRPASHIGRWNVLSKGTAVTVCTIPFSLFSSILLSNAQEIK